MINTPELNNLADNVFNAKLAQVNLVTKTDFDSKLLSFNRKIISSKTKHKQVENILNKIKIFDLSYFIGKSHFEKDGVQKYLVFQPLNKYFYINKYKYKLLPVLIQNIFHRGNLKDYQTKLLGLLLRVIMNLIRK